MGFLPVIGAAPGCGWGAFTCGGLSAGRRCSWCRRGLVLVLQVIIVVRGVAVYLLRGVVALVVVELGIGVSRLCALVEQLIVPTVWITPDALI